MQNDQLILGIETSCDDTAVALIKGKEVLAKLSFGQEETLAKWGGVVPEIAARNHLEKLVPVIRTVFEKSKIDPSDLSAISVTTVPGLLGPLLTGVNAAKTLALLFEKPIIPVNHLYAHLEAIHLSEDITYPYLGLLISGGHSIFFSVEAKDRFRVIAGTIDDAAGEAFDKGGKLLGLGYPAGHLIDRCAQFGEHGIYEFPIGLRSSADARLSFSGLKTSLKVFLEKSPHILNLRPNQFETKEEKSQDFYNVCASYQRAISQALLLKTRYALQQVETDQIVLGGGVACNSKIREDFLTRYPKTKIVLPEYCTDNGAMIANFGRINWEKAIDFPDCLQIDARGRFISKASNDSISKS